jgi:hypothetical protein
VRYCIRGEGCWDLRRLHLLRAWRQGDPPIGLATVLPRLTTTMDGVAASHATPLRTRLLTLWREARSFAATWLQAYLPGLQVRLTSLPLHRSGPT